MNLQYVTALFVPLITVILITPWVIKLAHKINAVDQPDPRKVHRKAMPRIGGLAIFIGAVVGYFTSGLATENLTAISLGGILILVLGVFDDLFTLTAKVKLLGQLIVAGIVVSSGLTIDFITIPFVVERFQLDLMAYPITILWIVGITNALNLIDGLDGLAAGISSIGILTIAIMALLSGKILILTIALIVLGSTFGFLFYNFYPAKIFMGDSGSLFLGYIISILSLLGLYKSVTLFSIIVPIVILGVPVFDTAFAIIRRIINNKPISAPDKSHLHHQIMESGLSHKNTVLFIYLLGILFSIAAILLSTNTLWVSLITVAFLIIVIALIAELVGVVGEKHKTLSKLYKKVFVKE